MKTSPTRNSDELRLPTYRVWIFWTRFLVSRQMTRRCSWSRWLISMSISWAASLGARIWKRSSKPDNTMRRVNSRAALMRAARMVPMPGSCCSSSMLRRCSPASPPTSVSICWVWDWSLLPSNNIINSASLRVLAPCRASRAKGCSSEAASRMRNGKVIERLMGTSQSVLQWRKIRSLIPFAWHEKVRTTPTSLPVLRPPSEVELGEGGNR